MGNYGLNLELVRDRKDEILFLYIFQLITVSFYWENVINSKFKKLQKRKEKGHRTCFSLATDACRHCGVVSKLVREMAKKRDGWLKSSRQVEVVTCLGSRLHALKAGSGISQLLKLVCLPEKGTP